MKDKEEQLVNYFNMLPLVVIWIEKEIYLSDTDIERISKFHAEKCRFLKTISVEEIIDINNRYVDHPTYGEMVKIVLSDKGQKWLREMYSRARNYMHKHDF